MCFQSVSNIGQLQFCVLCITAQTSVSLLLTVLHSVAQGVLNFVLKVFCKKFCSCFGLLIFPFFLFDEGRSLSYTCSYDPAQDNSRSYRQILMKFSELIVYLDLDRVIKFLAPHPFLPVS